MTPAQLDAAKRAVELHKEAKSEEHKKAATEALERAQSLLPPSYVLSMKWCMLQHGSDTLTRFSWGFEAFHAIQFVREQLGPGFVLTSAEGLVEPRGRLCYDLIVVTSTTTSKSDITPHLMGGGALGAGKVASVKMQELEPLQFDGVTTHVWWMQTTMMSGRRVLVLHWAKRRTDSALLESDIDLQVVYWVQEEKRQPYGFIGTWHTPCCRYVVSSTVRQFMRTRKCTFGSAVGMIVNEPLNFDAAQYPMMGAYTLSARMGLKAAASLKRTVHIIWEQVEPVTIYNGKHTGTIDWPDMLWDPSNLRPMVPSTLNGAKRELLHRYTHVADLQPVHGPNNFVSKANFECLTRVGLRLMPMPPCMLDQLLERIRHGCRATKSKVPITCQSVLRCFTRHQANELGFLQHTILTCLKNTVKRTKSGGPGIVVEDLTKIRWRIPYPQYGSLEDRVVEVGSQQLEVKQCWLAFARHLNTALAHRKATDEIFLQHHQAQLNKWQTAVQTGGIRVKETLAAFITQQQDDSMHAETFESEICRIAGEQCKPDVRIHVQSAFHDLINQHTQYFIVAARPDVNSDDFRGRWQAVADVTDIMIEAWQARERLTDPAMWNDEVAKPFRTRLINIAHHRSIFLSMDNLKDAIHVFGLIRALDGIELATGNLSSKLRSQNTICRDAHANVPNCNDELGYANPRTLLYRKMYGVLCAYQSLRYYATESPKNLSLAQHRVNTQKHIQDELASVMRTIKNIVAQLSNKRKREE